MGNLTTHPHVYKVLTVIFLVLFLYNSTVLLYNYDNINIIEVSEKSYTHQNMETKLNQNKYLKDIESKQTNRKTKFEILSNPNLSNYTTSNFYRYYQDGLKVINKTEEDNNKDLKLILLYDPVFRNFKDGLDQWKWYFPLESPFTCKNGFSCRLTTDHDKLTEASAVMVSLPGLPPDSNTWIPGGYIPPDHQKWVAVWAEAPWYFAQHQNITSWLQMLDDVFDWTASYHSDATFSGFYRQNCSYVKRKTIQPIDKESILKSKNNSALWVVSHCNSTSGRDKYAQDLQATGLINVTVYGKCSTSGEKTEDAFKNLDNYYFYLSFENSLCDDYITEKFFKMLKQNIVPVVMGAPRSDYERLAPPSSYIHVADFTSPTDLAKYLLHLQNNPDEYYEYLEWKEWYQLECPEFPWPGCQICQKLYQKEVPQKDLFRNFTLYWNSKKCYGQDFTNTRTSEDNM